jgi:hypothetical protein
MMGGAWRVTRGRDRGGLPGETRGARPRSALAAAGAQRIGCGRREAHWLRPGREGGFLLNATPGGNEQGSRPR